MSSSVLIAGPTGLVGRVALEFLLEDERFSRVIAATRRPLQEHSPRLDQWIAPDPVGALRTEPVDAVLCCLGTTIRTVRGDREAFKHVDKDMVVALAHWAKAAGARSFCVVSAIGADPRSGIFYSRVKGEMEEAVRAVGIRSTHLFRPGVLTGPREETRLGERVGIALTRLLAPILMGSLAKYRPMPHDMLASAMINAAVDMRAGVFVHTYREIAGLAQKAVT